MAAFLSDAWLDELGACASGLSEVAGASIVCQHEIAGAPDGKVRFYTVWSSGRLSEATRGTHDNPDCTIVAKAADALHVLRGDTELEVSFMQGRVKVDGDYRRLLVDLCAWRTSAEQRRLWADMAARTD